MLGFPLGILSAAGAGDLGPVFPSDITGLVARYDAADLTSISLSGSDVTQWNDLSGNGHHATQGTSTNRPKSGTRTLNGLNVLDFDGTNDFLFANSVAASLAGDDRPFTFFWVAQSDDTETTAVWSFGRAAFPDAYFYNFRRTGFQFRDGSNEVTFENGLNDTDPKLITFRSTGTSFNSYSVNTEIRAASFYNLASVTWDMFSLGSFRYRNTNTFFFNGRVGEFAYFNRQLTAGEVEEVQDYLAAKWGF